MDTQADRAYALRLNLRLMRICGLWPWHKPDSKTGSLKIFRFIVRNYCYVLHLPITFTFISLMWLEAFFSSNLEEAGQVLYMSITEMALVVKILNIWHQRSAAWYFLHELQQSPHYALETSNEQAIWQRHQRIFRWFFSIYTLISLGVVYSACIGVLFISDYELPFSYYVPFEWRSQHNYWYAYGYNVASMTLTCISNVTLDAFGCYVLFHISLLYCLLGLRLQALREVSNGAEFVLRLRRIFQLHQRVRRLTSICQSLVSPYVLSQIILSALIICFSGYRLQHVNIRDNTGQFVSMLQFVSVMVLQIYLPCYYGNEVTVFANQLTAEVYKTNWLDCTAPTRKLLIAYMELLKRPVKIRAANFFDIGLPIFVKTINNAYSFFALLLNASK